MRTQTKWLIGLSAAIGLAWAAAKVAGPDGGLGGAKVYEGGDANTVTSTQTPVFEVEHDWGLEVELSGVFTEVRLIPAYQAGEDYNQADLLPIFKQGNRLEQTCPTGGTYFLRFLGKGTWRVVVRAVGKL